MSQTAEPEEPQKLIYCKHCGNPIYPHFGDTYSGWIHTDTEWEKCEPNR